MFGLNSILLQWASCKDYSKETIQRIGKIYISHLKTFKDDSRGKVDDDEEKEEGATALMPFQKVRIGEIYISHLKTFKDDKVDDDEEKEEGATALMPFQKVS
ncbi:hypothetical protein GWI33_019367 [Rhynchophorus ferrugineus]|uniref:Uncharacterized protein n=1 Tax=Rhynchophorus ferrugineus TaxID=354439 RepID=A0A834HTW0_RHYFE|nr:hypothetical protein GWI33_019367 [Rhynchophorus ferrugineus]